MGIFHILINPFHATDLPLHPLKTSESQSFSNVFRRYKKGSATQNGLILSKFYQQFISLLDIWANKATVILQNQLM